jgi:DNA-binding NarL/FixJ family response regulator
MRAGARGYILKGATHAQVLRAVCGVGQGEAIFGPSVAQRVIDFFAAAPPAAAKVVFPALTEREREILQLLARGTPNPAIAAQLGLSTKTVANYVSNILGKLQVADRTQAAARARDAGLA